MGAAGAFDRTPSACSAEVWLCFRQDGQGTPAIPRIVRLRRPAKGIGLTTTRAAGAPAARGGQFEAGAVTVCRGWRHAMSPCGSFDSAGCDGDRRRGQTKQAEIRSPAAGRSAPLPGSVTDRGPSRSRRALITMTANRASGSGLAGSLARARRDMSSQTPTPESESYLFVIGDGQEDVSHNTVFYRADDAELAASICRLCEREYGGEVRFSHRLSSSFPPDEQVLLDEALDELSIYDDPDPGIYDPPPTRQTLLRAEYTRRCQRWEEMLKRRRKPAGAPAQPAPQTRSGGCSEAAECRLTDDDLLRICGIAEDDPELTTEHIGELHRVACLIGPQYVGTGARLELALSLLASVLGSFPRHNPTHLPFGYQGPTIKSHGWLDRDILERTGKQIVGLLWDDCAPDAVALRVEHAMSEAVRLSFLEETRYDAWRPGMPSGSGWRTAISATPYGITKARGTAEARPANPGAAEESKSIEVEALRRGGDPDAPHSAATSDRRAEGLLDATLAPLESCRASASGASPRCQERYPAVVATNDHFARLVDGVLYWRNGVLPFYWGGTYHPGDFKHRTSGPFQKALVWLEAHGYQLLAERMQRTYRDLIALVDDLDARYQAHPAPADATESDVIKRGLLLPCYDKTIAFVELLEDISKTTASEFPSAGECVPADEQGQAKSSASSDDRYEWARQIDLVRATNQVLGEGMLNKGVLSRACADGQVETNGKTGRGARVRVRSFLTWASRQNQLGAEETNQIRNAVIGEISSRNS